MATTPGAAGVPGDTISGRSIGTANRFDGAGKQVAPVTELGRGIVSAREQIRRTDGEQRNRRQYIPKLRSALVGAGEKSTAKGKVYPLPDSVADTGQNEDPYALPSLLPPSRAAFMLGR